MSITFTDVMDGCARFFECVAALVLVVGLFSAFVLAARVWRGTGDRHQGLRALRELFGGALLLGIEILVAADLIRTVAVDPSLENVLVLGLIVLIRTFLSFSLEIEIDGVPPWRRALVSGAALTTEATRRALSPPADAREG